MFHVAKRLKVIIGDVFVVPIQDGRVGVGQVVGVGEQPQLYYLAVFQDVLPEGASTEQQMSATGSPVRFLGLSMAAKFTAGHWTVVGSAPVPDQVELPAYKVSVGSPPNLGDRGPQRDASTSGDEAGSRAGAVPEGGVADVLRGRAAC